MKENYTQNFVTIQTSLLWHSSLHVHLKKLHSALWWIVQKVS